MASLSSVSEYLKIGRTNKHSNSSSSGQFRGEHNRRCRIPVQASNVLVSKSSLGRQDFLKMGQGRRGSHGHSYVQQGTSVLHVESTRPVCLGDRFHGSGRRLGSVQSFVYLPTFQFGGTGIVQDSCTEAEQSVTGGSMVAYQAILQDDLTAIQP